MTQLLLSEIEQRLMEIPPLLKLSDQKLGQANLNLEAFKEDLAIGQTNISLMVTDGKNETERKLKRDQAIAQDPKCCRDWEAVQRQKSEITDIEADNAALRREFAALCHIAELRAAQMYLMSRGEKIQ